ncbi:hypothetical protein I302_100949 [Kwoniella bestiolae CBS 10118]|uniref:Zinc finger Mcm10/DnaG-type domain-containing protein n=1 Tax=Kwoniella bestiolae CBS 10118 TaxID=1296100 RepID=A0A1B9G6K1_9TREE|nr:hypothetical protein I302_04326 [Kwoniella bestiolae CBS 10118]OCF26640.1 hypothetical protein I302_04326 [Kwoniella bestiolae CBS 10118]
MEVDTTDLDAQIAALQKLKDAKLAKAEESRRIKEKEQAKVLVGSTPTKASLRAAVKNDPTYLPSKPSQPNFTLDLKPKAKPMPKHRPGFAPQVLPSLLKAGPSKMGSSLAALRKGASSSPRPVASDVVRSNSFDQRNKPSSSTSSGQNHTGKGKGKEKERSPDLEIEYDDLEDSSKHITRDEDNLTIVENLELGPKEFGLDPEGEEEWRFVEPNSGIRLSKRILSHSHLQDHLSGRYFLTPSQIYSVIRLSKDGATYDIPVEGDWITIAVVAQRGEVKISGTKTATEDSDSEEEDYKEHDSKSLSEALKVDSNLHSGDEVTKRRKEYWKNKKQPKERKRVPRKYINYTLCSLPPRSRKGETSGDALLQLLLFEADAVVQEGTDEDGEVRKSYRGGSGGAYEKWCNLTEGNVVAILNPRVWRNLRGGSNGPHPLEFPLGLNPSSADSVILLGQAKDLGRCNAMQKDGNRCKTWVDLRQNQVCEYHIHAAIQRGKSSRAEFTASTSSFALASRPSLNNASSKGKLGFDPKKKQGLLPAAGRQAAPRGPENGGGGATYVVGGGVINTGSVSRGGLKGFGEEYLSEKLGSRSKSEKRKRHLEEKQAERALQGLLDREGRGGSTGAKYLAVLDKEKRSTGDGKKKKTGKDDEDEVERKRPFGAEAIKRIGFDPTSRSGNRDSEDVQRRLDAIAALRGEDPGCRLERISKKLEEERKAKRVKEDIQVDIPQRTIYSKDKEGSDSDEKGMIDLD